MNKDRKQELSTEELQEKNQFLETLINLSPDILYVYDIVEQKNVYSNDGVERILGYSAEEIKTFGTQLIPSLMHPDDLQVYLTETLARYAVAADGEQLKTQYRMKHKDGAWCWLLSNETIYQRLDDGTPKQIFGMIHDITASRKAEAALQESENALQHLIQHLHAAVVVHDADTNILLANEQASQLLGLSNDQMMGKQTIDPAWCFVYEDGLPMPVTEYPVTRVFTTKQPLQNMVLGINRPFTNDRVWVLVNAFPEFQDDGSIRQVVVTFIDITDRKQAEDALAAEKQMLNESRQKAQKLESLGLLAGGIAHDFNNLLGGMFGNVEMAQYYLDKNEFDMAKESLVNAFGVFDSTKVLTQQLLTFAEGGAPLRKVTDVAELLNTTAPVSLSGSTVVCAFDIAEDLWPCDCDENQIRQVVMNIVSNAQYAMPTGGTVHIAAENDYVTGAALKNERPEGTYVKIVFTDHGTGITEDVLPKIFDPFFTTKALGHGLGLATVYSIIKRHGGWIDVESEPGKGTEFRIFLPASPVGAAADPVKIGNAHTGKSALIMDDDDIMRKTECAMLASMGFQTVSAEDGREALKLFTEARTAGKGFTVSILDLTVHNGMGGKKTVSEIRKIDKNAVVIVASGYTDDPVMMHPNEYGFTAKIAKPFRKSELAALLNHISGKRNE